MLWPSLQLSGLQARNRGSAHEAFFARRRKVTIKRFIIGEKGVKKKLRFIFMDL